MLRTRQPQNGSYFIQEFLGEGRNSTVYKAVREDRKTGLTQTVALKILKSKNLVDIWKREFQSLSGVNSIHCVHILGFDWIAKNPALVLEFVDGLTLLEILRWRNLTTPEITEIVAQIEQGLRDLHAAGLVHGDLSLSNVMVARDGLVRLLDFGRGNHGDRQIQATPEFVAPEFYKHGQLSQASDLFALGIVWQHLQKLTGQPAKGECYLAEFPEKRRYAYEPSCENRRQQLGQTVQAVQQEKTRVQGTQDLSISPNDTKKSNPVQRIVAMVFLLGFVLAMGGEAPTRSAPSVTIRTQQWFEVWWDGRYLGYTPVTLQQVTRGRHRVRWRSYKRQGQRSLTLQKGEHIVLTDKFFFQQ